MKSSTVLLLSFLFFVIALAIAVSGQRSRTTPVDSSTQPRDTIGAREDGQWHQLSIAIRGQKQPIPANIGMGTQFAGYPFYSASMKMTYMHTHDASGVVHWEKMRGPITSDEMKLKQFFSVWGKTFTHDCIFAYCNGPQGHLTLSVNGKDNPDFEEYQVKDGDKIEIDYQ